MRADLRKQKRRKSKTRKWKRILISILFGIVLFGVILFAAFGILRATCYVILQEVPFFYDTGD